MRVDYDVTVDTDQLTGKFARLRAELVEAKARRADPDIIGRMVDELAATRRLIESKSKGPDEQTGDSQFLVP